MRYFWKILLLSILAVSLTLCKKSEDGIVISGRVIDPKQDLNLGGVRVELMAQKIESGIYSAHYDSYGVMLTDDAGNFSFNLESQTYASVKLSFSKTNYYNWEYAIDGEVIKNNPIHNETYQMQAKAWINFIIRNENPVDSGDYFDYRIMNGYTNCEHCCSNETMKFSGTEVDEDFVCQMIGHEDVAIRWNSRKGDGQTGDVKMVFIPSFDTTRIEFIY